MLKAKKNIRVINPDNGVVFTISIRDWNDLVFGIQVFPENDKQSNNPFTTKHRVMSRQSIQDWLSELQIA